MKKVVYSSMFYVPESKTMSLIDISSYTQVKQQTQYIIKNVVQYTSRTSFMQITFGHHCRHHLSTCKLI